MSRHAVWDPPPHDIVQINVDASFITDNGTGSVGIVGRDSMGGVLLSAWNFLNVRLLKRRSFVHVWLVYILRYLCRNRLF